LEAPTLAGKTNTGEGGTLEDVFADFPLTAKIEKLFLTVGL